MAGKRGAPFGNKNATGGFRRGAIGGILGAPGSFAAGALNEAKNNSKNTKRVILGAVASGAALGAAMKGSDTALWEIAPEYALENTIQGSVSTAAFNATGAYLGGVVAKNAKRKR